MHQDHTPDPASESTPDHSPALTLLSAVDARILGCLVEKEATTPDAYPLTANSMVLACNQKTSREPIMELEPGAVGHALRDLEDRKLVASVHGSRAQRYEHRFAKHYSLTTQQQALIAMLMLRGPQTLAELLTRCERLATFEDVSQVRDTLDRLVQKTPALVVNLGRAAGQREDRYMHLLCGPVDANDFAAPSATGSSNSSSRIALEARVEALESGIEQIKLDMAALRDNASAD